MKAEFLVKPKMKHVAKKLGLPYYELDANTLLKATRETISVYEPQVLQNNSDNWSTRQLANFVIAKNKFDFGRNNNCMIVGDAFKDNKTQIVTVSPDGKFSCGCLMNSRNNCYHIIVAKLKTGHSDKIKYQVSVKKLSTIQRSKTFERFGGKKNPRPLDLDRFDVEDFPFGQIQKPKPEQVFEGKSKTRKTYSRRPKQSSNEKEAAINSSKQQINFFVTEDQFAKDEDYICFMAKKQIANETDHSVASVVNNVA